MVAAFQQATEGLRSQLEQMIAALWLALGSYRDADRDRFVAQVVPLVAAAQRQMSALTVGYHNARRTLIVGRSRPVRVDPASVSGAAARNGVDPAEVYGRPFDHVWRELGKANQQRDEHFTWAGPEDERPALPPDGYVERAIQGGLDRTVQTALTDVQLAKTRTSQKVMAADPKVVGYRRVLEGDASCGLCIVASTLRYRKSVLLPIHPGCDCSVAEIFGDKDPGPTINVAALLDTHKAIRERFGKHASDARLIPGQKGLQYRDVLVTHEHGEIGPVLGIRGQDFTGPDDLDDKPAKPAPKRAAPAAPMGRTPAQIESELAALERNLPRLSNDRQRDWTNARIAELRRQLG